MATPTKAQEKARFEDIAKEVGEKYGYDEVKVELSNFADFKVRWTRSYKWINFQISDYLVGAPDKVVKDLFDVLYGKIAGLDREYSTAMKDWITREEFSKKGRKTYLSRHKAQAEQYKEFKGTSIHVSSKDIHQMAYCSTLFKTIVLNKDVVANAPADVIDNLIRHEYNVLQEGNASFGQDSDEVECDYMLVRDFANRFGLEFN